LTEGSLWRLQLLGEALDADRVLALTEMHIRPAENAPALFSLPSLQVKSGDRIAIVGRNGSGKSSLLRQLWLEYQRETTTLFHPRAKLGYYDQSLTQLHDEDSLNEALAHFAPLSDDQRKMALIGAGFPYLRHQQLVGSLSGGERSRLLFVGLTLARYSLLLLDEPTNHLDMLGKEELAAALNQFEGAVLLVSHDRNLIASSCNRFWLIQDQQLSEWHDFSQVIELMGAEQPSEKSVASVQPVAAESHNDEEELLLALCDLESKLDEDMMRKPKHQKPTLQTQWRVEIAQLKQLLGIS
jgi:ATP-binding cassette, subfamily F, member 3